MAVQQQPPFTVTAASPFPPPLHLSDDSASNHGSSFDDDSSSGPGSGSDSRFNTGSLADDDAEGDGNGDDDDDDDGDDDAHLQLDSHACIAGDKTMAILQPMIGGGLAAANASTRGGNSIMCSSRTVLPKGTKPGRLVGEGAANAVFEISVPPSSSSKAHFKGKLLRVAKVSPLSHAPISNYLKQQTFFNNCIEPRLGKHAVRQELVDLRESDIVDELNAILTKLDGSRRSKFRGSRIGQAAWGFLVDDMRPAGDKTELVEFKPKWLLQSPSAPGNAIRCRQCALGLRNFLYNPEAKKACPENKPCPLVLGNPNTTRLQRVSSPFRIAPQLVSRQTDNHFEAALEKIVNHDAIHQLRAQQETLDRVGPLKANRSDLNFTIAMTLRDCTCFALIPTDEETPIKIRLGDFDWKNPQVKIDHWRGTEKALVEGGFYTADWIVCDDGTYYHPPTLCLLEWTSGKRTGKPEILLVQQKNAAATKTESAESGTLASRLQSTTVYTHKTDLETLQKKLEPFKKEPAGTPPDAVFNPFRSDPP